MSVRPQRAREGEGGDRRVAGLTVREVARLLVEHLALRAEMDRLAHAPLGPLLAEFNARFERPVLSERTLGEWLEGDGFALVPGPEGPYAAGLHVPGLDPFVDFFLEHARPHPYGRVPSGPFLASYRAWSRARGAEPEAEGLVLAKLAAFGYPVRAEGERTAVLGLVAREFDPAGWSPEWRWPNPLDPRPPSWWMARSRRSGRSRRWAGAHARPGAP